MRALVVFLSLSVVYAADVSGRYSGVVTGKKPDGTGPEQPIAFVLVQQDSRLTVSGGGDFNRLEPLQDSTVEGDTVRFSAPWGGGIIIELKLDGQNLNGTLRPRPGGSPQPFDRVLLKRTGDLTVSDRVPRLRWEPPERSPRLTALRYELQSNGAVLPAFWDDVAKKGAPLIEPIEGNDRAYLVTFLWRGDSDTRSVMVMWPRLAQNRPDDWFMSHVDGTDLWFRTVKVRTGTRIHYQLSPNDPWEVRPGGTWQRAAQADPLNPKRDSDDPKRPLTRVRSVLELPGAMPQPYYAKRDNVPRSAMEERTVRSEILKGDRKIKVHTPPGYSTTGPAYPTLYYTDGEDGDGYVFASWTIENLIADKKIPPLVVVRIVNPDQNTRNRELACQKEFFDYLNGELVPFVRKNYNVSSDPKLTGFGGYSMGGLAAAYAGFSHPETFGLLMVQSPSLWYANTSDDFAEPNWLTRQYASKPKLPLKLYLEAGVYEVDLSGTGGGIIVPTRQLRDVLTAKGYDLIYREFIGDHDNVNWRGTFADGLITLYGK
jgi:enterochelin esterase-like enzyme